MLENIQSPNAIETKNGVRSLNQHIAHCKRGFRQRSPSVTVKQAACTVAELEHDVAEIFAHNRGVEPCEIA